MNVSQSVNYLTLYCHVAYNAYHLFDFLLHTLMQISIRLTCYNQLRNILIKSVVYENRLTNLSLKYYNDCMKLLSYSKKGHIP